MGHFDWRILTCDFTKDYITNLCNDDEDIYLEWPDGVEYVNHFPDKIDEFIYNYCDVMS